MALSASASGFARRATALLCPCALACNVALAQAQADTAQLLAQVNETVNRGFVQTPDAGDHWATPQELLRSGRGDCEDFAITKYFALLDAGVPRQHLRIAYALVQLGGGELWRPHMVLAYVGAGATGSPGEALILDSLLADIRPVARRPDLRVLFGFGLDGLWAGLDGPRLAIAQWRLDAWREVIERRASP